MPRTPAFGWVLCLVACVAVVPRPCLAKDKKQSKTSREIPVRDYSKEFLESRDPYALWLLFRRSGIVSLPVLKDPEATKTKTKIRLTPIIRPAGQRSWNIPNEVTVSSCKSFIDRLSKRSELDFKRWLDTLSDEQRQQHRTEIDEQKEKLWPDTVARLFKDLRVPKDWKRVNRGKIDAFKKNHSDGLVVSTEYYHILSTADEDTTRALGASLDIMTEQIYQTIFDFEEKVSWKYIVRFYGDRQEYRKSGGAREANAHFDLSTKELVGYDEPARSTKKLSKSKRERSRSREDRSRSFATFFHEGWHQYFDFYIPGAPRWFDEGFAEVIASTTIRRGKAIRSRSNPERYEVLARALKKEQLFPLHQLIEMDHDEFMKNATIAYAQSWSFVSFLVNSKQSKVKEIYRKYFWELRKGASAEAAARLAFGDIKIGKLEQAWKRAIPSQRKRR